METLYTLEELNGVDGGVLNLYKNEEDGCFLITIHPEHEEDGEPHSVWMTKEEFNEMAKIVNT